jgi:hypothetical protein
MKRKWLTTLLVGAVVTMLHADCDNMPIGTEVAKSIMGQNLDQAKKHLEVYKGQVKKYLEVCQEEGKQQQITIMQLTYEEEIKHLEENLKKSSEASFDCSKVPDDTALKNAFESGTIEEIKKAYKVYHKSAFDYLEHCALHESFGSVYEASLLYDDEYAQRIGK